MSQQGLIRFCSPVIKLYGELLWMDERLTDTSDLYDELYGLISALEIELEDSGFSKTIIKHSSYSLCCVLDGVMNRVKGIANENMAAGESLLLSIHDEVFAPIHLPKLARTLIDNSKADLSELLGLVFVLLEMGYQEQIAQSDESQQMLLSIEGDLSRKLAVSHKPMIKVIRSGLIPRQQKIRRRTAVPLWVSLSLVSLLVVGSYHVANLLLTQHFDSTVEKSKSLNNKKPS